MNSPHFTADDSGETAVNPAFFAAGLLALIVAAGAAGALSYEHITGYSLPGCGAGSPCAELANGKWGKLPGLEWPISFAGLAYFSGLLAAWLATRGALPRPLRAVVTAGALGSAGFIGIMLAMDHLCKYCLTSHLANFSFLALVGLSPRPGSPARPMRALAAGVFALFAVTGVLYAADAGVKHNVETKREDSFEKELREKFKAKAAEKPAAPAPAPKVEAPAAPAAAPASFVPKAVPVAAPPKVPGVFTGRYIFGPEKAPVQVVMFTDYQCPDCFELEKQVKKLLETHPNDVNIATKHFPFCIDCNQYVQNANFHPNACWAARAAEAAGILWGTEGFKKMHFWLFDHHGSFTAEELDKGLAELGWAGDRDRFIQVMTGPDTEARVKADVDEGEAYGLRTTPWMFVNGEELVNWKAQDALIRMVEAALAAHPEAKPAGAYPRPALAADKFVDEWRRAIQMAWPHRKKPWTHVSIDPAPPTVVVTMWGDLMEPNCAEADKIIRDTVIGDPQAAYEFRYYPFDNRCNPNVPRQIIAGGCEAAKAAEAAGQLGGLDAYWKMHAWITEHQKEFNEKTVRAEAESIGLKGDEFVAKMNSPDVAQVVAGDVDVGSRVHIEEIPRLFVNGKAVAHWKTPGGFVLERIIDEAHKKPDGNAHPPPVQPQVPGINAPIGK